MPDEAPETAPTRLSTTASEQVAKPTPPRRRPTRDLAPVLVRAAHPRDTLLTSAALSAVAALAARPGREVAPAALTVLVGQAVLG